MPWAYVQRTGDLLLGGAFVARGYSGFGLGRNNPQMQDLRGFGPIPSGLWTIDGPPEDTETHGPFVMRLLPDQCTETFGRSGFLLHGDSILHPGGASHGCIVMPREVRETVWASGDRSLLVSAEAGINAEPTKELA